MHSKVHQPALKVPASQGVTTGHIQRSSPVDSPLATAKGFTLLEILVVIVIVAIMFTFTALSIRTSSPEDLLETEARRLDRLIQLALEESILKGMEYGIEFSNRGYQFLNSIDGYVWQPLETDKMLRARKLPLDMEIELAVEETDIIIKDRTETGEEETDEKIRPQIFLLSSGEITPEFSARFVLPGIETSYIVKGTFDGKHSSAISDL